MTAPMPPIDAANPPPATDLLADLPPGWVIVAGAGLLAGLLLWAFGHRVLKPAFMVAGMAVGAGIGFAVAVALKLPLAEWIVAVVIAVIFGIFSWMAYRAAMGMCMAIVIGLASPIAVIGWAEYKGHHVVSQPEDQSGGVDGSDAASGERSPRHELGTKAGDSDLSDQQELIAEMRELLQQLREASDLPGDTRRMLRREWRAKSKELGIDVAETNEDRADDAVAAPPWREQFDLFVEHVRTEVKARWENAHPGVRRSIVLSVASGAILGLLIGLALPTIAASILTAMVGAGMALLFSWMLISSFVADAGESAWMPRGATVWFLIWAGLAVAGIALQWTIRRKPVDKGE